MEYGIFVNNDDLMKTYSTHKEALWHLMNDAEFDCPNSNRRDVFQIQKIEENKKCPRCNSEASWDGDTYVCDICNYCF